VIDGKDKGELTNIGTILPACTGTTIKQVELWAYKDSVVTATLPITVNIEANHLKDTEDWYYATSNAELKPTGNEETGWSQTAVSVSESTPYVWHLVKSIFSDGTEHKTTPTRTEWASPYSIDLSNDSATIGATYDGEINNEVLKNVSRTTVKVWHGGEDITDSCSFSWSVTSGSGGINSTETKTIFFTSLTSDTATATVTATYNGKNLTKAFTISKIKQSSACYVESSAGTLFEKDAKGETELIAKIFSGGSEIDSDGSEFTYKWYLNGVE
jgi:hypothetical protein